MRDVACADISSALERLFIAANTDLPAAVVERIELALGEEASPVGREVLAELLANARLARELEVPICQDTGLAVVFIEVGQDVHLTGGELAEAVREGVRDAYAKGHLRLSCCDPFSRVNTGDNTPPILHTSIVGGEHVRIIAMAKGGGSENYGEVRMLLPSEGMEGVKAFAKEMVRKGGPNICPPITIGVGVGGNLEAAAILSKEGLLVPFGQRNVDPRIAKLELEILGEINRLGIGPGGYGGRVTALDVHIRILPCHIASLPVAINIQCHAHRVREVTL